MLFFWYFYITKLSRKTSVWRYQNGKFRVSLKNICPCAQGCAAPEKGDRGQPACGCQLHDCSVSRSCGALSGDYKSSFFLLRPELMESQSLFIFLSIGTNDNALFSLFRLKSSSSFKWSLSNLQMVFKWDILRAL